MSVWAGSYKSWSVLIIFTWQCWLICNRRMFCVKFIFIDNNICLGLCGRSANLLLNECFPQFHLGVTNSIESHFAEYTFILIRWPIINMGGWWGVGVRVLRKKIDGVVRDPGFRNYTLSYGDRGPKSYSWLRKMGQSQTLDNRKSHQTNNFWSVHHIYIKFKTDIASSFTLLGQSSDTNCCFGLGLWSCFLPDPGVTIRMWKRGRRKISGFGCISDLWLHFLLPSWIFYDYLSMLELNLIHISKMGPCPPGSIWLRSSGPRFNIKMSSYQYRKSHCGDKTVVRSSYLHNGTSYTGKMTSLYWISPLWYCGGISVWY